MHIIEHVYAFLIWMLPHTTAGGWGAIPPWSGLYGQLYNFATGNMQNTLRMNFGSAINSSETAAKRVEEDAAVGFRVD